MTSTVDTTETLKLLTPDVLNIGHALNVIGRNNHPAVADLLPFKTGWQLDLYADDTYYIARMIDSPASGRKSGGSIMGCECPMPDEGCTCAKSTDCISLCQIGTSQTARGRGRPRVNAANWAATA